MEFTEYRFNFSKRNTPNTVAQEYARGRSGVSADGGRDEHPPQAFEQEILKAGMDGYRARETRDGT